MRRAAAIAGKLAVRLKADEQTQKLVKRAAEISKFDLVTHMIYEFPELQGVMGENMRACSAKMKPSLPR